MLSRVSDPRAAQYWDRGLVLSKAVQPVLIADAAPVAGKSSLVTGKYVWDFVAVFAPGARWDAAFPLPAFKGAPVADVARELSAHLPA